MLARPFSVTGIDEGSCIGHRKPSCSVFSSPLHFVRRGRAGTVRPGRVLPQNGSESGLRVCYGSSQVAGVSLVQPRVTWSQVLV